MLWQVGVRHFPSAPGGQQSSQWTVQPTGSLRSTTGAAVDGGGTAIGTTLQLTPTPGSLAATGQVEVMIGNVSDFGFADPCRALFTRGGYGINDCPDTIRLPDGATADTGTSSDGGIAVFWARPDHTWVFAAAGPDTGAAPHLTRDQLASFVADPDLTYPTPTPTG